MRGVELMLIVSVMAGLQGGVSYGSRFTSVLTMQRGVLVALRGWRKRLGVRWVVGGCVLWLLSYAERRNHLRGRPCLFLKRKWLLFPLTNCTLVRVLL